MSWLDDLKYLGTGIGETVKEPLEQFRTGVYNTYTPPPTQYNTSNIVSPLPDAATDPNS